MAKTKTALPINVNIILRALFFSDNFICSRIEFKSFICSLYVRFEQRFFHLAYEVLDVDQVFQFLVVFFHADHLFHFLAIAIFHIDQVLHFLGSKKTELIIAYLLFLNMTSQLSMVKSLYLYSSK
jgi:hypothetical protein